MPYTDITELGSLQVNVPAFPHTVLTPLLELQFAPAIGIFRSVPASEHVDFEITAKLQKFFERQFRFMLSWYLNLRRHRSLISPPLRSDSSPEIRKDI